MIKKVSTGFFLLLTTWLGAARADFSIAPRYEYIAADNEEFANRLIIKSKLGANKGYFGFYLDGFAEFDQNKVESALRRSPDRGYLQEAYLEFKKNSIYIRAGRQALRWSEMWVVPSLDIWTARRWNRLYLDPLSEQLVHPTGVSFSYARQSFSLDLVGITNLAENTYPEGVPPAAPPDADQTNGGVRVQLDLGGFHFSGIGAKQEQKYLYGVGVNYAFDAFVPKLEVGGRTDNSPTPLYDRPQEWFAAAGADVFLGNWIFTPQVTVFDYGDLRQKSGDPQSIYYLSGQWKVEPHDFQISGFTNPVNQDYFWSVSYSYNLSRYFSAGGFVQDYYGEKGSLQYLYRQLTGDGLVAGVRLELTGDWAF